MILKDDSHFINQVSMIIRRAEKFAYLATFGMSEHNKALQTLVDETKSPADIRLIVGRPMPTDYKSVERIMTLRKRLITFTDAAPHIKVRVAESHLKLYMNESYVVVGGRNLCFSSLADLSIRLPEATNRTLFRELEETFLEVWDDATPASEFVAIKESSWKDEAFVNMEEFRKKPTKKPIIGKPIHELKADIDKAEALLGGDFRPPVDSDDWDFHNPLQFPFNYDYIDGLG